MGKKLIKSNIQTLRSLKETGVTDNLTKLPVNRFEIKESKTRASTPKSIDNIEVMNVKTEKQLSKVTTIGELKTYIENFKGCPLHKDATNAVFSDGNPKSKIMLIGEAPGHDEDLQAKPFVGRSGKLLDKMLEAIDLNREKVYIANIIPWRPPANRRPTEDEINSCLPFILKHIEIIKPSALMLLGSTATFAILRNKEGISKIRGKWVDLKINQMTIPTMPTFHPAFLLRQPGQKKHVWTDLQSLRDKIKQK